MPRHSNKIDIYLEVGNKRTFACVVDWPGWCRSAHDEQSALQALVEYAPRYEQIAHAAFLDFKIPDGPSEFFVIERLEGNKTTDFGTPGIIWSGDAAPMSEADLERSQRLLEACWAAFDTAVQKAAGKPLRTGPRGGGRDLEGITQHVLGGDSGYLSAVGWKLKKDTTGDITEQLSRTRQAILSAMRASAAGELPKKGPRGGTRWPARYFVRRVAWHILDHVWEINDRVVLD